MARHSDESKASDTDTNAYAVRVGQRAHTAAGLVLSAGVESDRTRRVQQVIRACRQVLAAAPIDKRQRAALRDCATAVSAYLARFALPEDWEFLGVEIPLGGGRADVGYRHCEDGRIFLDEFKTGRGRTNETRLRSQITRYLEGGTDRWGDNFVGLRLCAVAEPQRSRFYIPGRERSVLLADSELVATVRR